MTTTVIAKKNEADDRRSNSTDRQAAEVLGCCAADRATAECGPEREATEAIPQIQNTQAAMIQTAASTFLVLSGGGSKTAPPAPPNPQRSHAPGRVLL